MRASREVLEDIGVVEAQLARLRREYTETVQREEIASGRLPVSVNGVCIGFSSLHHGAS